MSSITSANNNVVDRAREAVSAAADKVSDRTKEVVSMAGDRAKEAAGVAADRVNEAATAVSKKADQLTGTAGSNIKHFGETIQEKGPQEGAIGDASKSVGRTIEAGGRYLEEEQFSGMMDDVAGLIKRNPVPSILVGVGLGILIGRALRS